MPIPIKYYCEVATEGYVLKDGKIKEKQRVSLLGKVKYHQRVFTYDAVEDFAWMVDLCRGTQSQGDEAIVEFSNTWGHLIYNPFHRFPNEKRYGESAGKGQPKEVIFGKPYRQFILELQKQIEFGLSPLVSMGVNLDYHLIDGVMIPHARPPHLMFAIFLESKTNPPRSYITCQYHKNNDNKGRGWRGIDPVTKLPNKCPVGCRVKKTHPKQIWAFEKCRKAWEKRQERESKSNM